MRNLKRALSLALSSIMLFGIMVVGAGATNFPDGDKIVNKNAVAVTEAIGIFEGYEDGTFGPEKAVTRGQMAKIITMMLNGADVNPGGMSADFSDTDGHWAEGFIAMCQGKGIINGYEDGSFRPDRTVSTAEAAKMICVALGYLNPKDPTTEAHSWDLGAMTQAADLKLFGSMKLSSTEALSRDNVALMVFNALGETTVKYSATFDVYYNGASWADGMITDGSVETLMEKNFSELDQETGTDGMGRPTAIYSIDGEQVATVAEDTEGEYVGGEAIKVINAGMEMSLASAAANSGVYVNGTLVADYAALQAMTVFTDNAANVNDTLQAGWVIEAYDDVNGDGMGTAGAAADSVYVIYNHQYGAVSRTWVDTKDDDQMYAYIGGNRFQTEAFAKGDDVIYTMGDGDSSFDAADTILTMEDAKVVEGTVTGFKSGDYLLLDGTKYVLSKAAVNNVNGAADASGALKDSYRLFLDPNGYVVGTEKLSDSYSVGQYLVVKSAIDGLGTTTAKVMFADGTEAVVDVVDTDAATMNSAASAKTVFSYVEDDGEYTLTAMSSTLDDNNMGGAVETLTINRGHYLSGATTMSGYNYTMDTVFVDANEGVSYVGFENVPNVASGAVSYVYESGSNEISYVFFYGVADTSTSDNDYVYILDASKFYNGVDGKTVYTAYTEAYVDGIKTTIKVDDAKSITLNSGNLYSIDGVDANGYVTKVSAPVPASTTPVDMVSGSHFWAGETKYTVTDDSVIVVVVTDENDGTTGAVDYIVPGDRTDIFKNNSDVDGTGTADDKCFVTVVSKDSDNNVELAYVYVTFNQG